MENFTGSYRCPANIALIKYWGKNPDQTPLNPSLSFTLKNSVTHMTIDASLHKDQKHFVLQASDHFLKDLSSRLARLAEYEQWIHFLDLKVYGESTFPHSCGIASSASSMAALAYLLKDCYQHFFPNQQVVPQRQISSWARMLSGSACRSTSTGCQLWGKVDSIEQSSDDYATNVVNVHADFCHLRDSVVILDDSPKPVSSSEGHKRLLGHPYLGQRRERARLNLKKLLCVLENGDRNQFCSIVESEALDIHYMMMSGADPFCLLTGMSLEFIKDLWNWRNQQQIHVTFTIDAGPNIHVLYWPEDELVVKNWLANHILISHCQIIHDELIYSLDDLS